MGKSTPSKATPAKTRSSKGAPTPAPQPEPIQKRQLELLERQRQTAAERFGIEGDVPEVALRLLNKYDHAEAQAEFKLVATSLAAGQRLAAAGKTIPIDGNGNRAGPMASRKKGGKAGGGGGGAPAPGPAPSG